MDLEQRIREIVREEMRSVLNERTPIEADDRDRIAQHLVRIFFLYNGYKVDSRGPAGCIIDALEILMPDIVRQARDGTDWHAIYMSRWGEKS